MSLENHISMTVKQLLREQKIRYVEVAEYLELSEASVKRIMAQNDISMDKLIKIAELLGMEVSELIRKAEDREYLPDQLTIDQEMGILKDLKTLLVATCVFNNLTFEEITETYTISDFDVMLALATMEKLDILVRLPFNKFKLKIAKNFKWIPDGPIENFFKARVENDFMHHGKSLEYSFSFGLLPTHKIPEFREDISKLMAKFTEDHQESKAIPLADKGNFALLVSFKQWSPEFFNNMRRHKQ